MNISDEQKHTEEYFSAKAIAAILAMLEGRPTRVATSILERVGNLIKDASKETSVCAKDCLNADASGIIRWWLAKEETDQLADG